MDFKELEEKVREITIRTQPDFSIKSKREQEILAKTVKLSEEVGELCNDVLGILKLQRKSKLDKFDKENIYQEFADVVISLMSLASSAGVDLERAIKDKLVTIEKRVQKENKSAKSN